MEDLEDLSHDQGKQATFQQRLAAANSEREIGNDFFQQNMIGKAVGRYLKVESSSHWPRDQHNMLHHSHCPTPHHVTPTPLPPPSCYTHTSPTPIRLHPHLSHPHHVTPTPLPPTPPTMQAIRQLEPVRLKGEEEEEVWRASLKKLYLNLSLCNLKQRKSQLALSNCRRVLELDGKNVKALFRIGQVGLYTNSHHKHSLPAK